MTPPAAFLVQYGTSAFVGRFSASGVGLDRGERVVVRTPRGVEIGTVLCPADDPFTTAFDHLAGGELVRRATASDDADSSAHDELGRQILAAAEAADVPVAFLDVEVLHDGATAVLHVLPWAECDLDPHLAAWSARFGLAVTILDVSRQAAPAEPPAEAKSSCGSCGTGSGGCSSCGTGKSSCGSGGGCSRGTAKTAAELTSYFADLRQKMEAETTARRPLA